MSKFANKYLWRDREKRFALLAKREEMFEAFETSLLEPFPIGPLGMLEFALKAEKDKKFFEERYKRE